MFQFFLILFFLQWSQLQDFAYVSHNRVKRISGKYDGEVGSQSAGIHGYDFLKSHSL